MLPPDRAAVWSRALCPRACASGGGVARAAAKLDTTFGDTNIRALCAPMPCGGDLNAAQGARWGAAEVRHRTAQSAANKTRSQIEVKKRADNAADWIRRI